MGRMELCSFPWQFQFGVCHAQTLVQEPDILLRAELSGLDGGIGTLSEGTHKEALCISWVEPTLAGSLLLYGLYLRTCKRSCQRVPRAEIGVREHPLAGFCSLLPSLPGSLTDVFQMALFCQVAPLSGFRNGSRKRVRGAYEQICRSRGRLACAVRSLLSSCSSDYRQRQRLSRKTLIFCSGPLTRCSGSIACRTPVGCAREAFR